MNFKVFKACYPQVRKQEEEEYLKYLESKEKLRKEKSTEESIKPKQDDEKTR